MALFFLLQDFELKANLCSTQHTSKFNVRYKCQYKTQRDILFGQGVGLSSVIIHCKKKKDIRAKISMRTRTQAYLTLQTPEGRC